MKFKSILTVIVTGFVIYCGVLVAGSGVFSAGGSKNGPFILLQKEAAQQAKPQEVNEPNAISVNPVLQIASVALSPAIYTTDEPEASSVRIGAADPNSGFEFELVLNSKGASIERALLSGYKNRDPENRVPLEILTPTGKNVYSMANREFLLIEQKLQLPLHKENWNSYPVKTLADGSKQARFDINIYEQANDANEAKPFMKVTKTYTVVPNSYLLSCDVDIENMSAIDQKIRFNMNGPVGIGREDNRAEDRKVVGGFLNEKGQVVSDRTAIAGSGIINKTIGLKDGTSNYERALRTDNKAEIERARESLQIGHGLGNAKWETNFLWAALINKYFTAILVPVPENSKESCDWITERTGLYYNPDSDEKGDSGDETISIALGTAPKTIKARGNHLYSFKLYLGPKDKGIFDKNEMYRKLGFFNVIDFMACCCPAAVISPMAFGILAMMEWMHGFIGNYGIVIIILVFLVRIILHPLSKKGQVSMHRMGKLAPKMEEIKKKYAGNKVELQKQMTMLYREQGASPITGMIPMFIQMPIWIALYSAIYASVSLRGAAFLPFWITDLSAPDAAWTFKAFTLPLLGKVNSLNLLPLMMGVAFYLQQKLTPQPPSASTNPQMAQQQKMMKIMMPIMFPFMLYNAPSGLNLYIMASTFGGVVEQYVIRKHIREKEETESEGLVSVTAKTGGKVKKKKPKPFFKNR